MYYRTTVARLGIAIMAGGLIASGVIGASPAQALPGAAQRDLQLVQRVTPKSAAQSRGGAARRQPVKIAGETVSTDVGIIKIGTKSLSQYDDGGSHVVDAAEAGYVINDKSDGLQISAVVRSAGTTTLRYSFPGKALQQLPDGSVVVREGVRGEPVALLDPAWAKDASGAPVGTSYAISGDILVQKVAASGTTHFPVVADPRLRWAWYGASVDFTRHDTNLIATGAGGCALASLFIPDPTVTKVVAVSCGLVGLWAGYASGEGKCVSVKITWAALATPWNPGSGIIPWVTNCYA